MNYVCLEFIFKLYIYHYLNQFLLARDWADASKFDDSIILCRNKTFCQNLNLVLIIFLFCLFVTLSHIPWHFLLLSLGRVCLRIHSYNNDNVYYQTKHLRDSFMPGLRKTSLCISALGKSEPWKRPDAHTVQ